MKPASHRVGAFDLVVLGLFLGAIGGMEWFFHGVTLTTIVLGVMFLAACVYSWCTRP